MSFKLFTAGALLAATLQTGWLGLMIEQRAALLRSGQEVTLASGMIDPRDIFRGHYVTLRLDIERQDSEALQIDVTDWTRGADVWAELTPGVAQSDPWQVATLHNRQPETGAPVLRGKLRSTYGSTIQIDFPIDRFFAPKERALALEDMRRDSQLGVILALAPDGSAALKGITVAGEKLYEDPLY